ncbi:hypothetical protein P9112_000408 [Eukaryota sp. TZLM1-RC]
MSEYEELPLTSDMMIDQLKEMESMEEGFVDSLLQMFQDDYNEKIVSMEKALESNSLTSFAENAHSLKGSAGNLGMERLAKVFATLQTAGFNNDMDTCKVNFPIAKDLVGPSMEGVRSRIASGD